jgi:hypothetical protein
MQRENMDNNEDIHPDLSFGGNGLDSSSSLTCKIDE